MAQTFSFFWEGKGEITVAPVQIEDTMHIYRLTVSYPQKQFPERIRLWWFTPFNDTFSTWSPTCRTRRDVMPSWCPVDTWSRSASGAPMFTLLAQNGENRCTFALSDAAVPARLTGGLEERNGMTNCTIELFVNPVDMLSHYEVLLRIDVTPCPYYEAIYGVRGWWHSLGYIAAPVPQAAQKTMFSSWYSFQKNITEETVLAQCRLAKDLGMDTLILDDGWQCDDTVPGYSHCGDWQPVESKFPDMRRFIDRLHAMGMQCILWYSVPYMGAYAKNYERFRGKYLRSSGKDVMVLDPRYADVRAWLVEIYVDALQKWDLDGFKLDFIDSFALSPESSTNYDDMDCPSLEAAVEKLLDEVKTALTQLKPDILIEFRQSYIGPVMQKYGNILRVGDCAGAALVNRVSSIDLRLLTGDPTRHPTTAIHSDMLMWDYDATPEGAADQLAACLFCTPQISVMFDRLSPAHKKVLTCYMSFLDRYRDVLLHGTLRPLHPEANYAQVIAQKEDVTIAALYAAPLYKEPLAARTILVNATGEPVVYVQSAFPRTCTCRIENCMGEVLRQERINLVPGVTPFVVPHNGFVYLETEGNAD